MRKYSLDAIYGQLKELEEKRINTQSWTVRNDVYDKTRQLEAIRNILQNNRRIDLYNSSINVIFEVLKKYEGKQAGAKTKEKLYQELKDITKFSVRVADHTIYIDDAKTFTSLEISTDCHKEESGRFQFIDNDNKYSIEAIGHTYIYNALYIKDIDSHIAKINKLRKAISEKVEEVEKLISSHNELVNIEKFDIIYIQSVKGDTYQI